MFEDEDDDFDRQVINLKVYLGNLDRTTYVLMACSTHAQFLACTGCLPRHSFGETHSVDFAQVALARPGVPLVRKIHELTAHWRDMTRAMPTRKSRRLTAEDLVA